MRCCIIPIAAHRPTRLRGREQFLLLLQFFDPTRIASHWRRLIKQEIQSKSFAISANCELSSKKNPLANAMRLFASTSIKPFESLVVRRIRDWLANPAVLLQAVQHAASDAATQNRLVERARHFAAGDHNLGIEGLRTLMCSSIVRVQVHVDRIDITLDPDRVCGCLDDTAKQTELIGKAQSEANRDVITLSIPARLKRTGKEMRIIVDDGSEPSNSRHRPCASPRPRQRNPRSASRGSKPDLRGYCQIRGRRSVLCDAALPSHDIGA